MIKGIQIKNRISFKDYLTYCMYPTKKKKPFKFFVGFSILCFIALALLITINAINHNLTTKVIVPPLIFICIYAFLISSTIINMHKRYNKAKSSFQKEMIFSFLNNKFTIALSNKPDETIDIFNEKILMMEETRKKVFIVLVDNKYYMLDKSNFIDGNIIDLRVWANKHVKVIKMSR